MLSETENGNFSHSLTMILFFYNAIYHGEILCPGINVDILFIPIFTIHVMKEIRGSVVNNLSHTLLFQIHTM